MKRFAAYYPPKDNRWVMALLGLLTGIEFFENSLFLFSSSHIQGGIGATPREFVLIIAVYASTCMLVIMKQAWLAHRLGYRNFLSLSLILFIVGAVLSGLSQSVYELMIARAIQGLGGGALFTSCRILINLMFSGESRKRAVPYFIISIFIALALAPALAAMWIANHSWRWVFWAAIPPAFIATIACYLWLPVIVPKQQHGGKVFLLPLISFTVGIICLQLAISEARFDFFANSAHFIFLLLLGILLLSAFVRQQYKHPSPIFVLRGLANSVYLVGLGLYFVYYFLRSFANYLFPIYAEQAQGIPLQTTGLLNSFSAAVALCAIIVYMRWSYKIKAKKILVLLGMVALIAPSIYLSFSPPNLPASALILPLAVKGMFSVLVIIPIAGLTFRELKTEYFANGYRNKNLMRQWAGSFGQATAAVMLQNRQAVIHEQFASTANQFNPAFNHVLHAFTIMFKQQGFIDSISSRQAALEQIAKIIDKQALLLACNDLYRVLAGFGLVAAIIIFSQKKLR